LRQLRVGLRAIHAKKQNVGQCSALRPNKTGFQIGQLEKKRKEQKEKNRKE
jgi:hypothetical protein